jgi:tyrosyl-tRNA synthetase
MTVFEELKERGLIAQITNEEKVKDLLDNNRITFYTGFDATADSLHVGHFLPIILMMHLQKAGHRPIALLGTATTRIGDPTGKSDMRKVLSPEQIRHNTDKFRKQISQFLDFSDDKACIVENGDWIFPLNYLDFLSDIGRHFSVNRMLAADCFKTRLERGLSFIEFNYMIMQSYDFLHLYRTQNCVLECGGDDQWSNILGGTDLVRRVEGKEVFGMTITLLTTSEGKKMGKTEKGAVWLDSEKTSPFDFYQYWRNIEDSDVIRCLKMLTFISLEQIKEYECLEGSELNRVKELLAFELTKLVHGEDEAIKSMNTAKALFQENVIGENMPCVILGCGDFTDDQIDICTLTLKTGFVKSKSEARRLVSQSGIYLNDQIVPDVDMMISKDDIKSNDIILRKGKKNFCKIVLE